MLTDAAAAARARDLQRRWVTFTGGDGAAKDLARVLRTPGYKNWKSEYAPDYPTVTFITGGDGALYNLSALDAVLPPPVPTLPPTAAAARVSIPLGVYNAELDKAARRVYHTITNAMDGDKHRRVYIAAARAGSYAAGGVGTVGEWRQLLTVAIDTLPNVKDRNSALKTIEAGLVQGQAAPLVIETSARAGDYTPKAPPVPPKNIVIPPPTPPPTPPQTPPFPRLMTIPPERASLPGLVLPDGQWQRQPNGAITVTFKTAAELDDCITATRACRGVKQNGVEIFPPQ
jgi:hypothetical protein